MQTHRGITRNNSVGFSVSIIEIGNRHPREGGDLAVEIKSRYFAQRKTNI